MPRPRTAFHRRLANADATAVLVSEIDERVVEVEKLPPVVKFHDTELKNLEPTVRTSTLRLDQIEPQVTDHADRLRDVETVLLEFPAIKDRLNKAVTDLETAVKAQAALEATVASGVEELNDRINRLIRAKELKLDTLAAIGISQATINELKKIKIDTPEKLLTAAMRNGVEAIANKLTNVSADDVRSWLARLV
jgi:hypothetical protein